mmetsp:Transcript_66398/g.200548  ORF Transcript_66398/g.200548 Transcript_66398/m.200548 type:complete len:83 (-) Transcript_66398:321-569(-)
MLISTARATLLQRYQAHPRPRRRTPALPPHVVAAAVAVIAPAAAAAVLVSAATLATAHTAFQSANKNGLQHMLSVTVSSLGN